MCWINGLVQYGLKKNVQVYPSLLLINHGLVLIAGVKSTIIPYLLSEGSIRGLEMTWDMRFVHIINRYLKHDEPSDIWRTNTLTMTNQPTSGEGSSVLFFYLPTYIFMVTNKYILNTISYAWEYLYNHPHTKTLVSHLISKWLGSWRTSPALPYSPCYISPTKG